MRKVIWSLVLARLPLTMFTDQASTAIISSLGRCLLAKYNAMPFRFTASSMTLAMWREGTRWPLCESISEGGKGKGKASQQVSWQPHSPAPPHPLCEEPVPFLHHPHVCKAEDPMLAPTPEFLTKDFCLQPGPELKFDTEYDRAKVPPYNGSDPTLPLDS